MTGADKTKLDGIDGANYLRADISNTAFGGMVYQGTAINIPALTFKLDVAYAASWHRGTWIKDSTNTMLASVGVSGTGQVINHTYMGWGTSPELSANSLAVWSDKFTYKDNVVYHAGNFIAGTNYEAADTTIVKDADIGVTVAAQSHNHSGVYQPVDTDLTNIAALTGTAGFLKTDGATVWSVDTSAYSTTSHNHSGVYEPADTTIVKDADIGVTVQAYDVDTAKLDVVQSFTAEQTFKELKETDYALTGTVIDPANGSRQYKTLSANTTFTESLENGQAVTLMIDDGTAYTVTWPTITWIPGAAPTLPVTGFFPIVLFKMNSVLYGTYRG
jgi:hypothetical protein